MRVLNDLIVDFERKALSKDDREFKKTWIESETSILNTRIEIELSKLVNERLDDLLYSIGRQDVKHIIQSHLIYPTKTKKLSGGVVMPVKGNVVTKGYFEIGNEKVGFEIEFGFSLDDYEYPQYIKVDGVLFPFSEAGFKEFLSKFDKEEEVTGEK